ncbi:MAG: non-canonical purine NTP pyrophosphatase, partial [Saprospiraceae bacterium]
MDLIFASHNTHKVREVEDILGKELVSIKGLDDIGFHDEIEETGGTLVENALIKARAVYIKTGQNVFSDDTGLEVYALDLAPGV